MARRKKIPNVMAELLAGGAGIPANQQAGKPVNRYDSMPVDQQPEEKVKATYYLGQQTVDALEEAKFKLRRLFPKDKRQISSSAIVDAALQIVFAELETEGAKSQLASILVSQ